MRAPPAGKVLVAAMSLLAAAHAHAAGAPLSLDDALRIAVAQAPRLGAQRALAEGASLEIVPAGALPDPKLKVAPEDVPTNTFERFTAKDFHGWLKVGLMQEFPGGDKRDLRTRRAEQEARLSLTEVELERAAVQRDVATAWIERRYADEAEAKVAEQIAEAELAVEAASAGYRAGKTTQSDLIALQRAVVELGNRRTEFVLQAKRATISLARYIGAAADRPLGRLPDVAQAPPGVDGHLDVEALPEVRSGRAREAVRSADADLALEENWPDFSVEFDYKWRGRAGPVVQFEPGHGVEPFQVYSQLMSLEVEVGLPFFSSTRQAPRHAAKLKELDAATNARVDASRRRSAEVDGKLAEWESAREQAARIRDELIPLAIQRREAAVAAYRGGTGPLATVLAARRSVLAAQLALIAQEQAAGKAWAWLAYVFPVADKS
jgi:outer membrane protein TolC